jgi:hypothetical protein
MLLKNLHKMKNLLLILLFVGLYNVANAQLVTNQCESNPCQALPVCNTNTVNPYAYNTTASTLPAAVTTCAAGTSAFGGNWVFYEIKVLTAGTITFTISPPDTTSAFNYDFAFFRTTYSGCNGLADSNRIACNTYPKIFGGNIVCPQGKIGLNPASIYLGFNTTVVNANVGDKYILGISRKLPTTPPWHKVVLQLLLVVQQVLQILHHQQQLPINYKIQYVLHLCG